MKTSLKLWSIFALLSLGVLLTEARAAAVFDAAQIEAAVVDYYRLSHRRSDEAQELASALSEEIALLHPVPFNDLIGHLLADYRHHPENRAAINALIAEVRDVSAAELRPAGKDQWIQTVIDDTFTAWAAAYAFGFGKGLWKSRGNGLGTLPRFREAISHAGAHIPLHLRTKLGITAAGASTGALHVVLNGLEIRKADPEHLLEAVQKDLLNDLQDQVTELSNALHSLGKSAAPKRGRKLDQLERAAQRIQSEAAAIHQTSPRLHGRLSLIFEDLQTLEAGISDARSDRLIRALEDAR